MRNTKTRNTVLTALFAALTAVLAQIQLPIGPVPFNLAVLGAFLAGMMLPPLWAACSMAVYLLLGLVGVPVFAGLMGGPAAVFGKTGGYAVGYVLIAALTALAARGTLQPWKVGSAMVLGLVGCYTLGTVWFMVVTGTGLLQSLAWCVFPFVVPDVCKGVCGYLLGRLLRARMAKMRT